MKVAVGATPTHNPSDETCWASGLRENLTSRSYGEGLETGRAMTQAPRQSLTRQHPIKLHALAFTMALQATEHGDIGGRCCATKPYHLAPAFEDVGVRDALVGRFTNHPSVLVPHM